jgi:hypothetical protein
MSGSHFLSAVLGRGRCGDQGGIDDGALAQQQALVGQMRLDSFEDALGQLVRLEQVTELDQGGGIRGGLTSQVDTHEAADRLAVVEGIFDPLVGQAEALLGDVHAQHALQADGRAPRAFALGVERSDLADQRRPRGHRFDLGQEAVAPGALFLGGVFQVGKARLHRRGSAGWRGGYCISIQWPRPCFQNSSAFP